MDSTTNSTIITEKVPSLAPQWLSFNRELPASSTPSPKGGSPRNSDRNMVGNGPFRMPRKEHSAQSLFYLPPSSSSPSSSSPQPSSPRVGHPKALGRSRSSPVFDLENPDNVPLHHTPHGPRTLSPKHGLPNPLPPAQNQKNIPKTEPSSPPTLDDQNFPSLSKNARPPLLSSRSHPNLFDNDNNPNWQQQQKVVLGEENGQSKAASPIYSPPPSNNSNSPTNNNISSPTHNNGVSSTSNIIPLSKPHFGQPPFSSPPITMAQLVNLPQPAPPPVTTPSPPTPSPEELAKLEKLKVLYPAAAKTPRKGTGPQKSLKLPLDRTFKKFPSESSLLPNTPLPPAPQQQPTNIANPNGRPIPKRTITPVSNGAHPLMSSVSIATSNSDEKARNHFFQGIIKREKSGENLVSDIPLLSLARTNGTSPHLDDHGLGITLEEPLPRPTQHKHPLSNTHPPSKNSSLTQLHHSSPNPCPHPSTESNNNQLPPTQSLHTSLMSLEDEERFLRGLGWKPQEEDPVPELNDEEIAAVMLKLTLSNNKPRTILTPPPDNMSIYSGQHP